MVTPGGGHIASMTLLSGRGANLNPLSLPPWKSVEPAPGRKPTARTATLPAPRSFPLSLATTSVRRLFRRAEHPRNRRRNPGARRGSLRGLDRPPGDRHPPGIPRPSAERTDDRDLPHRPHAEQLALWITETVQNQSSFDRPFGWQQHPTIGPPFLQDGASYFDMPATWSVVYPKEFSKGSG